MKAFRFMLLAAVVLMVAGCQSENIDGYVPVEAVAINRTAATLSFEKEYETVSLSAQVFPENASNKNVVWSSENESVAKVDQNGAVTAVGVGTTEISILSEDGSRSATCSVTVVDDMEQFTKEILYSVFSKLTSESTLAEWNWRMDRKLSDWEGINVNKTGGKKTFQIRLFDQGLTGPLSGALFCIPGLEALDLSRNNLSGEIPVEVGNAADLTGLYLDGNNLTGEIPAELANLSNLGTLMLSVNRLSGKIPSALGKLSETISMLDLRFNQLTGQVPKSLKRSQMYSNFWFNPQREGFELIDTEIGEFDKVALLLLRQKWGENAPFSVKNTWKEENSIVEFEGVGVNGMGQVVALSLNLMTEEAVRTMPDFSVFPELREIIFGTSPISTLPEWVKNVKKLRNLRIVVCPFSDIRSVTELKTLEYLEISFSTVSAELPAELGNLEQLEYLICIDSSLFGEIPAELGNLKKLRYLDISGNCLSGEVPESLLNNPYFSDWSLLPQQNGYGFSNLSEE